MKRYILSQATSISIFLNFAFVYTKSETVNTTVCSPLIFHTFAPADDHLALQHIIILCQTNTICVINSSLDSWYLIYETQWDVLC
jgi:hypothetical protein